MTTNKEPRPERLHPQGDKRYRNEWSDLRWEQRVVIKWIGWLAIVVGIVGWFLLNVILALVLNSNITDLLTYNVGYWLMVAATWWLRPNSQRSSRSTQNRKDD